MDPSAGRSGVFGGETQEAFLERIRARMRASRGRAAPPEGYPGGDWGSGGDRRDRRSDAGPGDPGRDGERLEAGYEERLALFSKSLEAVGGKVSRAADAGEAFALIAAEFRRRGVRRALVGGGDWTALREALATGDAPPGPAPGVVLDEWTERTSAPGDRSLEAVDAWDAGISWVEYGVAELGSVVVVAAGDQGRSVSLLPPFYVALVRGDRLVTKRRTVLERIAATARASGRMPSFTFITGPSRSADIEMDLSIGVHGPGEVWAIVVDPPGLSRSERE